jgi:hypothetical protein
MNAPTKAKTRKCRICREPYMQFNSLKVTCGKFECQVAYAEAHVKRAVVVRERAERKETQERIRKLKPLNKWLKDVEYWFNRYIRLRDAHLPCISCDTVASVQYAAGHYRTVKAAGQLRFHEDNVHKQCNSHCNRYMSGNCVEYRIRLVKKIGLERVEALENNHDLHTYTIDECKGLISIYKFKCKAIEHANSH